MCVEQDLDGRPKGHARNWAQELQDDPDTTPLNPLTMLQSVLQSYDKFQAPARWLGG